MENKSRTHLIVLITVLLVICIGMFTYILVQSNMLNLYRSGAFSTEISGESASFAEKAMKKISEVDSLYRKNYIGELDDDELIDSMISGYVAGTGDLYGMYYNKDDVATLDSSLSGEFEGIGVTVVYNYDEEGLEVVGINPGSPAESSDIKIGDIIVGVGEDCQMVSDIGYSMAVSTVRGKEGTTATIFIKREGESDLIRLDIQRAKITEVSIYSRIYSENEKIGIIRITGFDRKTPGQFISAMEELREAGCERIIFDLRNNPGGELTGVLDVLDYLLPEGPIIRIFDSEGNQVEEYSSDASSVQMPYVILTNGNTASAAELFTSAMRDYDMAKVVGTTTYGKGCMQMSQYLSDGSALSVTYRMFKPPFSESYHGIGIVPDVEVEPNEEVENTNLFLLDDKDDNQLKAAVEEILKIK